MWSWCPGDINDARNAITSCADSYRDATLAEITGVYTEATGDCRAAVRAMPVIGDTVIEDPVPVTLNQ